MNRYLDPTLDVVFKLLLGSPETKECLIALLTAVLKPVSPIRDVEVLNPGIAKENIDDKGIVLDLLMLLADGTTADLEMQVRKRTGFRRRALYYLARAYTSQLVRGQEYIALRPAVLIAFLCYEETTAQRLHSVFEFREIHDQRAFSKDLSLHLIELPKLEQMTPKEEKAETDLVRWAKFFTASTDEELEATAKGDMMMEKTMDFLEKLSAKADVRLLAERREMAQLMYRMELTMARDEAMAEGEAKGKAEGEAKGEAKGEARGIVQGKRDVLLMLLEKDGRALSDKQRQVIASCEDLPRLDHWLRRAVDGAPPEDIFG
jgi:predicted transposase/invertase (TIGR01784 family)